MTAKVSGRRCALAAPRTAATSGALAVVLLITSLPLSGLSPEVGRLLIGFVVLAARSIEAGYCAWLRSPPGADLPCAGSTTRRGSATLGPCGMIYADISLT
jgi:hypothetical protein